LRTTLAWAGVAALLAAAPAAAEPFPSNPGQPVPAETLRVVQLEGPVDLRELAATVNEGRVIALVPAGADLKADAPVAFPGNLDVLVQPDGHEDGPAVDALAAAGAFVYHLSGAPCDVPCVDAALRALDLSGDEPTVEGPTPVRAAIVAPARDGGGITLPAAALAVVLLALAGALTVTLVTRLRPPPEEPAPPARPQLPAAGAYAGRARVVSVLDPEGYVEVEGCLRRARWAADGAPPNPGEWVELDRRNGRLWASPPMSRPRSRASA
jgi:hypothetical protein